MSQPNMPETPAPQRRSWRSLPRDVHRGGRTKCRLMSPWLRVKFAVWWKDCLVDNYFLGMALTPGNYAMFTNIDG